MKLINRRNLLLRVGLALVVIASTWVAFQGGFGFLSAQTMPAVDEPFSKTDPLSGNALELQSTNVPNNKQYRIEYSHSIRTSTQTLHEERLEIAINNLDPRKGYLYQNNVIEDEPDPVEFYEVPGTRYVHQDEEVTTVKLDDTRSKVLKNQIVNAGRVLHRFNVFTWTLSEVSEDQYVYRLSRADTVGFENMSRVESARGRLVVNTEGENPYVETATVSVTGSYAESPSESVFISYDYNVEIPTEVTKPDWVPS